MRCFPTCSKNLISCCISLFYFQILGSFLVAGKWNYMEMISFTYRCDFFLVNNILSDSDIFLLLASRILFQIWIRERVKQSEDGGCSEVNAWLMSSRPYMWSLELQRKSEAKNRSRYLKVFFLELLHCVTDKLSS